MKVIRTAEQAAELVQEEYKVRYSDECSCSGQMTLCLALEGRGSQVLRAY